VNSEVNIQHSSADELRQQIVAAAQERFGQFGFAKTSMQEIAAACSMSAANLYRFYDGKQAIGAAVVAADQAALLAACDRAAAAATGGAAGRLIALLETNIDESRRRMKRTPLLFELTVNVVRERRERRRQLLDEFERRIASLLAAGPFAAPATQARLVLMASAPFLLPWMLLNEPFGNPRPLVAPLVRRLLAGLAVAPTGPTTRFA
jgi:AcrR family transcriptional regulator